ncbi:DinB family protein [Skermania sp. ID1734]|uniref:DinB family protein n=1 Tax=Skermania sp. ID1734 TaxID=2597516 RepID=UPI00117C1F5D|nr:DinB family protein [Skermania sp. ID1734]
MILPETKDWTWVLTRQCPECGFDAAAIDYDDVPDALRGTAAGWPAVLSRADVRVRPNPSTWSALEYGAHVRDVCRTIQRRLELILEADGAQFPNWDQDATAVEARYNSQDPIAVGRELLAAADSAATAFASVPQSMRSRRGVRSDGAEFSVDSLARYFLHDLLHHAHDVSKPN